MSATNRGGKRRANDFYETPRPYTEAFLNRFVEKYETRQPKFFTGFNRVLEPAAGRGAMIWPMRAKLGINHLTTVEVMPSNNVQLMRRVAPNVMYRGDFRHFANVAHRRREQYDLIMTNPPFSMAETYAWRCQDLLMPNGFLVLLLRLAFLESKGRAAFHKRHPSDVFVLPQRPSYTGDGNSDMAAYAWFVWGPGCGNYWEIL